MKKLWLIFLLPILLISCPKEEIVPEENGPIMVVAEIGPAGATLEADGISITVPPGAFTTTQTVQITLEEEFTSDFEGNAASPIYLITGIPSIYKGNLILALQYNVTLEDESYLAIGESHEMFETEGEAISYALYETKDSSGYLVSQIPSPEEEPEEGANQGSALKSTSNIVPFKFIAQALYKMSTVEGKYFLFQCPQQSVREKVQQLAGYMDDAMQEYFRMKLLSQTLWDKLTVWGRPQVAITNLVDTEFNDYMVKMPSLGPYPKAEEDGRINLERFSHLMKIKTNLSRTVIDRASPEELKSIAYLLAYRMVYYMQFGDAMDWFAYASAVWISEKYSGIPHYDPSAFSFSGKSPFMGMEAGKKIYPWGAAVNSYIGGKILRHEGKHALGMYPFVKYLDNRYPDDQELYMRIMREILLSESKTPMEGIINALDEPEYQWWPGFFEKYMTQQLVDVPAEEFLKLFPGVDYQVDFSAENDTTLFNDADYADLSARLYKVSFLFPSFEKEATLNLKLGPPSLNLNYVTSLAFGLKDEQLEYFDRSRDLTITNMKALADNDYSSIIVAVVNSANEPSTDETLNIELDSKLQTTPEDLNCVLINSIKARSIYTDNSGATNEGQVLYLDGTPRKGEMKNYEFTATWSEPLSSGTTSGTIVIKFDPETYPRRITGINITETRKLSDTRTYTIVGENIDFPGYKDQTGTIATYNFFASGAEVCDYLTYINEDFRNYDGTYTYSTDGMPICNDKSGINMKLYYLEE